MDEYGSTEWNLMLNIRSSNALPHTELKYSLSSLMTDTPRLNNCMVQVSYILISGTIFCKPLLIHRLQLIS